MSAPIAKGIIVSVSLLLAAGLAAYEHPQIKQWVDGSRRKIAFALHNLGDDLDPPSRRGHGSFRDASTREDESPEAAERRRKARQEILERGRMMEERRRSHQAKSTESKSFDDLVDEGGNLKPEVAHASSSTAEPQPQQQGLRNRHHESYDPFAAQLTEAYLEAFSTTTAPVRTLTHRSHSSSTATLPASTTPPPVPPKEPLPQTPPEVPATASQPQLLIDIDDLSTHPSEALVDLTPSTSAASAAADLSELDQEPFPSDHSQTNFWSVHEWAENNTAPAHFYTPPRSEAAVGEHDDRGDAKRSRDVQSNEDSDESRSETGTGERVSRIGSMSDMDVMSEIGGISTPGSWSEVGSRISEDY
ncbi:MAG: hypothetical protein Q9219_006420 [cf. Caloplaca sp. 3 TL-2023]